MDQGDLPMHGSRLPSRTLPAALPGTSLRAVSRTCLLTLLLSISLLWPPLGFAQEPEESDMETQITQLVEAMTLEEKVGQTALRGFSSRSAQSADVLADEIRAGRAGALLNVMDRQVVDQLQKVAVEESRLGIPLLFARDVIHGFRTIFPIPLGQAASWSPELVETGARVAAEEASTFGIRWTFAPMLDIARDSRWGRIAESPGEDPFLAERIAEAAVRGFQGEDPTSATSLAACAKHFAAYGAAEGGRDYNSAFVSEAQMRNVYLRPFDAAVEAGALTIMTGFNELNGVPVTADPWLLTDVLRGEWGFDGFVVSDWESVTEMIAHGFSRDPEHAAAQAMQAGTDMEMTSRAYEAHLVELVRSGQVPEAALDRAVAAILRVKMKLGLFDHPWRDATRDDVLLAPEYLEEARKAARQSLVLLKNQDLLPLNPEISKVAVVGPLADAPHEQLGTWTFDGKKENSVTPVTALRDRLGGDRVIFAPALEYSRDRSTEGFAAARAAAEQADVVLFFGGEEAILSGEAHSRADLRMPGVQEALLAELAQLDKPIVLVLMAGRPLDVEAVLEEVDALMMAWHPGTMGGPAIVDVLFGDHGPQGRLPVTWPKAAGQEPIYYNHKNTGRPAPAPDEEQPLPFDEIPVGAWQSSLSNTSRYLDLGSRPRFPFGFGLTYTTFEYRGLKAGARHLSEGAETGARQISDGTASAVQLTPDDVLTVEVEVANTGSRPGTEVVQLYTRDLVGSLTRPVRELKGFQSVALKPGESQKVQFELPASALAFYNHKGESVLEAGAFEVWVGAHAEDARLGQRFELVDPSEDSQGSGETP